MFDLLLLGRLRANKDQTWWEGQGPVPTSCDHPLWRDVMRSPMSDPRHTLRCFLVFKCESPGGNPIGKALVKITRITGISIY